MAEAILFDLAASILETLGSSVFDEISQLKNFKNEAKKLGSLVSTVQTVILDAEDQYYFSENRQIKDWVKKLKEALEDADNLLDDINTEALRQQVMDGNNYMKKVRLFFSKSNSIIYGVKMAREIKAIRERLNDIKNERKFHLVERPVNVPSSHRKGAETHSSCPHIVVGREEDKKKIIGLLLSSNHEEDNVSFISIWGMGGLGKTALAKLVFNDEDVGQEFEKPLRFWVCVSDDFDPKAILKNMLDVSGETQLNLNSLTKKLHEKINGKKYLLVLDDVWNEDVNKWREFKDLLMGGRRGSKIIVTTRSMKTAKMTSTLHLHELEGLSVEDSWNLFVKNAFRPGLTFQSANHEKIGREILNKCKGVPLAIQTIGATLYLDETESAWSAFKDKELSEVNQNDTDIIPTLQLSYNRLPSHLKQCFAICSLYPKDHKIQIDQLIRLWIGQGYVIPEQPSQCMQELGFQYFEHLLHGSFFQEVEVDKWGDSIECKMHDLMHDLAKKMAGEECVSLGFVERAGISTKARHVNVYQSEKESILSLEENKVRTILYSKDWRCNRPEIEKRFLEFIANSRYLRALVMESEYFGWNTNFLLDRIHQLKHLRYLELSLNKGIRTLPNSITKLLNLQILDLNRCVQLKELPKDINRLFNLIELHLEQCNSLTHMPRGIGKLTALQVLSRFVVSQQNNSAKLDELKDLNNLKGNLEIVNLKKVKVADECKAANLNAKQHLRCLRLEWDTPTNDGNDSCGENEERCLEELRPHINLKSLLVVGYGGVRFCNWISNLTNLVKISIVKCRNCRKLPPLNHISSLKRLSIKDMDELELIEVISTAPFFLCLEKFALEDCPKLKGWSWTRTSTITNQDCIISRLSSLVIRNCLNLTNWSPSLPSLNKLTLNLCDANETMRILRSTISSSSTMASSGLVHLEMVDISELQTLPEDLSRHFISLKSLLIKNCSKLRSVSLRHLTSLTNLKIMKCEEFDTFDFDGSGLKNLRYFEISRIPKLVTLSDDLQRAIALEEFEIVDCGNLKYLPEWMGNLVDLEKLSVINCEELEIFNMNGYHALKHLRIEGIPKLEAIPDGLQHATNLHDLIIWRCENLKCLPEWTGNLIDLKLLNVKNCEELDISNMNGYHALRNLWIEGIPKLEAIPDGLQHATHLHGLTIRGCKNLKCLPEWMGNLVNLENLIIRECEELDISNMNGYHTLKHLEIESIPKLEAIPDGLQHATNLQWLIIRGCENLKCLPAWLPNLTSLQWLGIRGCSEELSETYKNNAAKGWLSHIPTVYIG